jgi:hypothetical protein
VLINPDEIRDTAKSAVTFLILFPFPNIFLT